MALRRALGVYEKAQEISCAFLLVTRTGAFASLKENQRFSVRSVNDGIAKNERHPMGSS